MLDDPALSAYFRVLGFDIDDAAWRLTTSGMCWWNVRIRLKAGSPEPVMWDSPMNFSSGDGKPLLKLVISGMVHDWVYHIRPLTVARGPWALMSSLGLARTMPTQL